MNLRDQLLRKYTGKSSEYWMARIQEEIWKSAKGEADEIHPECDAIMWTGAVTAELVLCVEELEDYPGDGNILVAYLVAVVFSTWASRIAHAKAYDPNRPLGLRRRALKRHARLGLALVEAVFDETSDAKYFGQEWNPPYGPSARGGNFT